jgi:hypothetical protein
MNFRIIVLMLAVLPVVSFAQLRATDLTDPPPIAVPDGAAHEDVRNAVLDAMLGRGWEVAEEGDDFILADLHIRRHWARVHIAIGEDSIQIAYRDSDNLNYGERRGRTVIHKNYLGWVENLAGDIRNHLARIR